MVHLIPCLEPNCSVHLGVSKTQGAVALINTSNQGVHNIEDTHKRDPQLAKAAIWTMIGSNVYGLIVRHHLVLIPFFV